MSSIFETVQQLVAEQLGVPPDEVTLDANFANDLGADSLDTVELVLVIEEHFGFEIPDEDAEQITTLNAAVQYISKKLDK